MAAVTEDQLAEELTPSPSCEEQNPKLLNAYFWTSAHTSMDDGFATLSTSSSASAASACPTTTPQHRSHLRKSPGGRKLTFDCAASSELGERPLSRDLFETSEPMAVATLTACL